MLDVTWLRELVEEYLEPLDNMEDIEVIATQKSLSRVELETFLEWLEEQPNRLDIA